MDYRDIIAAAREVGLDGRGGFYPDGEDGVPPLGDGRTVGTLILLGNAGPGMWSAFEASPEASTSDSPLDRWSRRVVGALAERLGAEPLYPFGGPPWWPFQRWARRAEPVHPSPIGPLIHPQFGLWHAYRGALAFGEAIDLPAREHAPSPCESCADRPCLHTCPVSALTAGAYDVPACVAHVDSPAGQDCLRGCLARRACPVGRDYQYPPRQALLHMRAFVGANRNRG